MKDLINHHILFVLGLLFFSPTMAQKITSKISWKVIAQLPAEGNAPSLGYAGMVCGVVDKYLLVGGGANFPDAMPWQGGKKMYSGNYNLLKEVNGDFSWEKNLAFQLPENIAYAAQTNVPGGFVFAGGENNAGLSDKVWLIKLNDDKKVEFSALPNLPEPTTGAGLVYVNGTLIFVGGDTQKQTSHKIFSLDLNGKNSSWKELGPLPQALANFSVALVSSKNKNRVLIIGGRRKTASGISQLSSSVFVGDISKNTWENLPGIFDGDAITPFTATNIFTINNRWIVLAGGDKGDVFNKIENYLVKIKNAANNNEKDILTAEKNLLTQHHTGFSTDILLFDVKKKKWSKIGNLPVAAQVTAGSTLWNNSFIIASGEIRPGVRTPFILAGRME